MTGGQELGGASQHVMHRVKQWREALRKGRRCCWQREQGSNDCLYKALDEAKYLGRACRFLYRLIGLSRMLIAVRKRLLLYLPRFGLCERCSHEDQPVRLGKFTA